MTLAEFGVLTFSHYSLTLGEPLRVIDPPESRPTADKEHAEKRGLSPGGYEMPRTQCAALMSDGRRCRHAAAPEGLFCASHTPVGIEAASAIPGAEGTQPLSGAAMRQWLLGTLQAEIHSLCAADLPPLDRATAIAGLGELFLQALPSAESDARVAELEVRTAEVDRMTRKD
jgi:hypothetical protein